MASRNLSAAIVSAVVGSLGAFVTCLILFFFVFKPAPPVDAKPSSDPGIPTATPGGEIPNLDINPNDVKSVSIRTVYKGYFDPGDKCAKTYNEYFGNSDGSFSPSSPCSLTLKFGKDGSASRTIDIQRLSKTSGMQTVEKTESASTITPEQFEVLAKSIVGNSAFKAWRQGTMINVSNCSITVEYSGGTKTPMSNVDESATEFLPMIDAFKKLEKKISWKTV